MEEHHAIGTKDSRWPAVFQNVEVVQINTEIVKAMKKIITAKVYLLNRWNRHVMLRREDDSRQWKSSYSVFISIYLIHMTWTNTEGFLKKIFAFIFWKSIIS